MFEWQFKKMQCGNSMVEQSLSILLCISSIISFHSSILFLPSSSSLLICVWGIAFLLQGLKNHLSLPGLYCSRIDNKNAFLLTGPYCSRMDNEYLAVVDIRRENLEADTLSYHCNCSSIIRHICLDSIDPSLAIGFYCRDKDDFDDFCIRASKLADESNGAPLFTVAHIHSLPKPISCSDGMDDCSGFREDDSFDVVSNKGAEGYEHEHEDDWQLL
ncbi:Cysteine protease ATG4 [Vitis vinifera]|uniref:Cysteine protease n=1 Tax=Vitis vinifera TaxID=29760 RepID=A0A438KQ33_VITVI|nr:Cysteine protease ATG4 [Vitis vinifera]